MSLADTVLYLSRSNAAHSLSSLAIGSHITIFSLHRPISEDHSHKGISPAFLRTALDKLLSAGYCFASVEEVLQNPAALPPKSVCLTMDDGYADQAEHLAPILAEYKTKATFFVITDLLDRIDWPWDEKIAYLLGATRNKMVTGLERFGLPLNMSIETSTLQDSVRRLLQRKGKELNISEVSALIDTLSEACGIEAPHLPPRGYQAMTWDQARELEQAGIRFAPHSCNHHITTRQPMDAARQQFRASWERVVKELSNPAKVYCYPTGRPQDFATQHEEALAALGYLGAVSFISHPLRLKHLKEERFRLPRIAFPDTLGAVFRYASWIEALRSVKHLPR